MAKKGMAKWRGWIGSSGQFYRGIRRGVWALERADHLVDWCTAQVEGLLRTGQGLAFGSSDARRGRSTSKGYLSIGAAGENRTLDLSLTKGVLYL